MGRHSQLRAFAIAVTHSATIYDSFYVAISEQRDVEFVGADVRLIRQLSSDRNLGKRMVWVGDLPFPKDDRPD